ncbi:MAG: hypothetical protein ACE5IW_06455 [bacterium]
MKTLIKSNIIWAVLIIISTFFLSGCYTQLAKPQVQSEEQEYYVEEEQEYEGEEEYQEEGEDYDEVHITRRYYHDIHYYGAPWWYDPFFDPYFYRYYYPYSSHISIHIGYYDPFFYDPFFWYDPYWYDPYGYYGGPVFAFGFFRRPFHYYSYYPVHIGTVHSVPVKKRSFTRGRTRIEDDFGYDPQRAAVKNSSQTGKLSKSGLSSDEPSSKSVRRRRKINSTELAEASGNSKTRLSKPTATRAKNIRRKKESTNRNETFKPESKPVAKASSKPIRIGKRKAVLKSKSTGKRTKGVSYKNRRSRSTSKSNVRRSSSKKVYKRSKGSSAKYVKSSSGNKRSGGSSIRRSGSRMSGGHKSSSSKGSSRGSSRSRRGRR